MDSVGHSGTQAPHAIQSSKIFIGIAYSPDVFSYGLCRAPDGDEPWVTGILYSWNTNALLEEYR
jgi:hypothetical protein